MGFFRLPCSSLVLTICCISSQRIYDICIAFAIFASPFTVLGPSSDNFDLSGSGKASLASRAGENPNFCGFLPYYRLNRRQKPCCSHNISGVCEVLRIWSREASNKDAISRCSFGHLSLSHHLMSGLLEPITPQCQFP